MKTPWESMAALGVALLLAGIGIIPMPVQAATQALSPKDETVKKYLDGCQSKPAKEPNCEKLKKDAVEILKEDLLTLGSSANHGYVLSIVPVFKREEAELRIAAADAIGMIGPQESDAELLAPVANDPVPDVRRAVAQMISRGKGNTFTLLVQRTNSMRMGLMPETPADAGKYSMPVAPESTYLFYASEAALGRLSYVARGMNEAAAFFKSKARRGPMKLEEFQDAYRYQLQDEQQALDRAQEAAAKQIESVKAPDPANTQAFMEYMEKVQSVNAGRSMRMLLDSYQPNFFGSPTVYVLEERQIGQRSYPTRYAVLYQDHALRKPGYRLSWVTVPDDAIKAAQVASLKEEQQEVARKKESESLKKHAEELQSLEKKKDEAERKKFKKGQDDLEKALGF